MVDTQKIAVKSVQALPGLIRGSASEMQGGVLPGISGALVGGQASVAQANTIQKQSQLQDAGSYKYGSSAGQGVQWYWIVFWCVLALIIVGSFIAIIYKVVMGKSKKAKKEEQRQLITGKH